MLSPPNSQAGGSPLDCCQLLIIQYIRNYPHIWRPSPSTKRPGVETRKSKLLSRSPNKSPHLPTADKTGVWRWLSSGMLRRIVWFNWQTFQRCLLLPSSGHLWIVGKLLPDYTRRNIPEDSHCHTQCRENLKSQGWGSLLWRTAQNKYDLITSHRVIY
jgi:hypothetical protein